jgi:hypothetical protein
MRHGALNYVSYVRIKFNAQIQLNMPIVDLQIKKYSLHCTVRLRHHL